MRLPQSFHRHFSLFFITTFLISILTFPFSAQGSTQQLTCSPSTLSFGGVAVGQSETQLVTLTNNGQASVTVSGVTAGSAVYTTPGLILPMVLSSGQSVEVSVAFTPNGDGWFGDNIAFKSNASDTNLKLSVHGSGVSSQGVTAVPASLSFGQVGEGSTVTLPVVLTNTRSWQMTLNGLQASGAGFSVSGPSMPMKLAPGKTITLNVSFDPQVAGLAGGSVLVSGVNLNIPLSGTGTTATVGQLSESPSVLSFGNVDVGSPSTQPYTITASGGPVTISSASSNNSQFTIGGVTFPLTLNPSQSAQVYVTFSPTKSGSASATVTLGSNASNGQELESASGVGVVATYSVNLSWSASSSQVAGYNVYRGTSVGSYSKVNSSLDPSTAYTDNSVTSGMTYYYAATAVSSSGQESPYSAPVQISVP